jgi:hypothetical protein
MNNYELKTKLYALELIASLLVLFVLFVLVVLFFVCVCVT